MKFCVALLSLYLATSMSLQDNITSATSLHTSATVTPTESFTVHQLSSGIPSSSVPLTSSTTPSLTPPPAPGAKYYSLNYTNSSQSCVMLSVSEPIRFISNYTVGNKTVNSTVTIPDPRNVSISGFCSISISDKLDRSAISLNWSSNGSVYVFTATFLYNKKDNGKKRMGLDKWFLESATYTRDNSTFIRNVTLNDTDTIVSDIRRAYTCDNPFILELYPEPKNSTVTWLNMTQYTIQPFALNLTDFHFQFLDSCEPGGIPLVVPIIVAGILAAFVLVLLFLYVIGRFRQSKKGKYERLT